MLSLAPPDTTPTTARRTLGALFNDVLSRTPTPDVSRLLDLGCGPGRVSLSIADHFDETWAEDLLADEASFCLVTIGEAFHRMDQRSVAQQVLHWLVPGGCLAIPWYEHIWQGEELWKRRVSEIISCYRQSSNNSSDLAPQSCMTFEEVLDATGFQDVQQCVYQEGRTWSIEQLTGYLSSISVCSKRALGNRQQDFEAEISRVLLETDAAGRFYETATFGCITALTPAR